MTELLPGGPVSRDASCPVPLVELLCADGGDFVTFAIPVCTSPFQSVCRAVVAVVWIAHFSVNQMNVYTG